MSETVFYLRVLFAPLLSTTSPTRLCRRNDSSAAGGAVTERHEVSAERHLT